MRRILSLGLAISTLLVVFSATATAFDGGNGSEADPYQIATAADLINLGQTIADYDKHFILTADIDFLGYIFDKAVIAPDPSTDYGFQGTSFSGIFNGNGHSISNLIIDASQTNNDYLGLFGHCEGEGSEIKNLGLKSVNIVGGDDSYYVGGLCGYIKYTAAYNCFVIGNVKGRLSVGGLCGSSRENNISKCYASCNVIGNQYIGCLFGYKQYTNVDCCYSKGTVIGNDGSSGIGGFCGDSRLCTIDNCYSQATVIAGIDSSEIGGFCGYFYRGTIANYYSAGYVQAGRDSIEIGGVFGESYSSQSINGFWDMDTARLDGSLGDWLGRSTVQMQDINTFLDVNWDFVNETTNGSEDIWIMDGYPALAWQDFDAFYPPVVVAMEKTDAQTTLINAGFTIGDITFKYNSTINSGFVIQQSIYGPVDSTGIAIDLVISLGQAPSIGISQEEIEFLSTNDAELQTFSFEVYNSGGNLLDWQISYECPWIVAISPETVSDVDPNDICIVNVTIDSSQAEFGDFVTDLVISDIDGIADDQIVTVYLHKFDGGDGSSVNPYQISSAKQLIAIGSNQRVLNRCFILNTDIDLADYTFATAVIVPDTDSFSDGHQGYDFDGTFNGNGYIIQNLTICTANADPNNSYLGLFGKTGYDAVIKNLGLENVNIISGKNSEYIGGICGYNCGEIHQSFVTGNMSGDSSGGICGYNKRKLTEYRKIGYFYAYSIDVGSGGIINDCYTNCIASCGICEINDIGIIENCYASGIVSNGICRDNLTRTFEQRDYLWYQGPYIEHFVDITGIINNCFWDTEISGTTTSAGGIGLTTAQMQNISTYLDAGWDFAGLSINGTADIWYMPIDDYPILRWQNLDIIMIPNVIFMTQAQAEATIVNSGLIVGDISYAYSEDIASGLVISQNPFGSFAETGDAINIVVSLGQSPAIGFGNLVYDPDMPDTTATLILSFEVFNAGENALNWQVSGPSSLDVIITPESGSSLNPADRTTVTATFDISMLETGGYEDFLIISDVDGILADVEVPFSFYIYETIVPEILSMIQVQARTAIADAELVVGEISYGYSPTIPSGAIMSQSPSANTYAKRGDAVDMIISLGKTPGIGLSQQNFVLDISDASVQETISFKIFNEGGNILDWEIVYDCPWIISVSPDNGVSSDPNDQTTVTAIIDVSLLDFGYNSTVLAIKEINGILEDKTVAIILNVINSVNLEEFALLSEYWLTDCSDPNHPGKEIDLITDGQINIADLQQLLECWMNKKVTKPFAGLGTTADPYQVSTAGQLISIGTDVTLLDKHFILTADIDLAGYTFDNAIIARDTDNSTDTFAGISFSGVFNGDGHIISNLTIDTAGAGNDYLGLFGSISGPTAKIENLGIIANITGGSGSRYLGGLCGKLSNGSVTNCYTSGAISGYKYLGGLCGGISDAGITACYASCNVNGYYYLGGLCGNFATSSMSNSYAIGTVSGDYFVGGLCGYLSNGSLINCYASGAVNANDYLGGLCGDNNDSITITACFWDTETSGQSTSDGGTGLDTAAMQNIETYLNAGWDFLGETANGSEDIWQMPPAGGYPILHWQE
ncbi:MAG: PASTA domain-containing protein [Phycisphaerae bacterium]|nr:PASTA domain-containing protein [Phycisphaerae bacterium]